MIGIFSSFKDKDYIVTSKLVEALKNADFSLCIENSCTKEYSGVQKLPMNKMINDIDVLIYVGGDGTILSHVNLLARHNVPVIGVNIGRIGFLSEIEANEIDLLINILKSNEYILDKRSLLKIKYNNNDYYSLNEVSITKSQDHNIVSLNVKVDNSLLGILVGDGVIVSSPTGSTAYSFSAGGPIVSPNLNGFVFTPLCAHSYRSMPMVLDSKAKILVSSLYKDEKAIVNIDGIRLVEETDINLEISLSDKYINFIKIKNESFYNKLLNKLKV